MEAEGRLFPYALSIIQDCSTMLIDFPPSSFISGLRLVRMNNRWRQTKFTCILGIRDPHL